MTFLSVRRPDKQVQVVLQGWARSVGPYESYLERSAAANGEGGGLSSPVSSAVPSSRKWTESLNVAPISTRPNPSELFGMPPVSEGTYWPVTSSAPLINMALTKAALGVAS